ncbi:MAG: hypothetical protein ACXVH1_36230 [Solirubrobacteraceae bacterium]
MREGALVGASGSSRLGLALLQHRGVRAWTRAWHTATPTPINSGPVAAPVCGQEIVGVLATIALACAAAA